MSWSNVSTNIIMLPDDGIGCLEGTNLQGGNIYIGLVECPFSDSDWVSDEDNPISRCEGLNDPYPVCGPGNSPAVNVNIGHNNGESGTVNVTVYAYFDNPETVSDNPCAVQGWQSSLGVVQLDYGNPFEGIVSADFTGVNCTPYETFDGCASPTAENYYCTENPNDCNDPDECDGDCETNPPYWLVDDGSCEWNVCGDSDGCNYDSGCATSPQSDYATSDYGNGCTGNCLYPENYDPYCYDSDGDGLGAGTEYHYCPGTAPNNYVQDCTDINDEVDCAVNIIDDCLQCDPCTNSETYPTCSFYHDISACETLRDAAVHEASGVYQEFSMGDWSEFDCNCVCGGDSYYSPNCGCIANGGDEEFCYGCTDASACNYDGTAYYNDGCIDFASTPQNLSCNSCTEANISDYHNEIDVTWDASNPVTHYKVMIRALPSGEWSLQTLSNLDGSHSFTGLLSDTPYEIKVSAINTDCPDMTDGQSSWSNSIEITTRPTPNAGCMNDIRCNYDPTYTQDCEGIYPGLDGYGNELCCTSPICGDTETPYDSEVNPSCYNEYDECGICDGDNYAELCIDNTPRDEIEGCSIMDCAGICNGDSEVDHCDYCVCGETTSDGDEVCGNYDHPMYGSITYCWFGHNVVAPGADTCTSFAAGPHICDGDILESDDEIPKLKCDGDWSGGDRWDCTGVCNGTNQLDQCEECNCNGTEYNCMRDPLDFLMNSADEGCGCGNGAPTTYYQDLDLDGDGNPDVSTEWCGTYDDPINYEDGLYCIENCIEGTLPHVDPFPQDWTPPIWVSNDGDGDDNCNSSCNGEETEDCPTGSEIGTPPALDDCGSCYAWYGEEGCGTFDLDSGSDTFCYKVTDSDQESNKDCAGICANHGDFGAFFDSCDVCSGGESGHIADSDIDCAGVCFGDALIDDCGVCYCPTGSDSQIAGGECEVQEVDADKDDCGLCPDDPSGLYQNGVDCAGNCSSETPEGENNENSACYPDYQTGDVEGDTNCGRDICGVCNGDGSSCTGCMDVLACNNNEGCEDDFSGLCHVDDDETCEYETCYGCIDLVACNTHENCEESYLSPDGNCLFDGGGCDYSACGGCLDENATNTDGDALLDTNTCEYNDSAILGIEVACSSGTCFSGGKIFVSGTQTNVYVEQNSLSTATEIIISDITEQENGHPEIPIDTEGIYQSPIIKIDPSNPNVSLHTTISMEYDIPPDDFDKTLKLIKIDEGGRWELTNISIVCDTTCTFDTSLFGTFAIIYTEADSFIYGCIDDASGEDWYGDEDKCGGIFDDEANINDFSCLYTVYECGSAELPDPDECCPGDEVCFDPYNECQNTDYCSAEWCVDSYDGVFDEAGCITNYSNIISAEDFTFLELFYGTPDNELYVDNDGVTWSDLDEWILTQDDRITKLDGLYTEWFGLGVGSIDCCGGDLCDGYIECDISTSGCYITDDQCGIDETCFNTTTTNNCYEGNDEYSCYLNEDQCGDGETCFNTTTTNNCYEGNDEYSCYLNEDQCGDGETCCGDTCSDMVTGCDDSVTIEQSEDFSCGYLIEGEEYIHCTGGNNDTDYYTQWCITEVGNSFTCEDLSCIGDVVLGCTDENACNYNADANVDDGSCLENDECGICGGSGIEEGTCDCEGNIEDCSGECGGDKMLDMCGTCDNDPSNDCIQDCAGDWGGTLELDDCGVCGGSGPEDNFDCDGNCIVDIDCTGECGGSAVTDECGICGGDNTLDCAGVCGGDAVLDECDICDGDGTSCLDCCGIPNGDGSSCNGECGPCNEGYPEGACDCDGNVDLDCGCGEPVYGCNNVCSEADAQEDLGCGCGEEGPSGCDLTCGSTLEITTFYFDYDGDGLGGPQSHDWCPSAVTCHTDGTPGWCINTDDTDDTIYCTSGNIGCDAVCDSSAEVDECGVCGGDSSSCDEGCGPNLPGPSGCDNECGSDLVDDECGICGGDSSSCDEGCGPNLPGPSGCDNECGSTKTFTTCYEDVDFDGWGNPEVTENQCTEGEQTCEDGWSFYSTDDNEGCDGTYYICEENQCGGGCEVECVPRVDCGSFCGGIICPLDESCVDPPEHFDCDGCDSGEDCTGECGGSKEYDDCGVCDGDNSSCSGCTDDTACNFLEICTQTNSPGEAGYCIDDGSCTQPDTGYDCDGICITACDCAGVYQGTAELDCFGVCDGGAYDCGCGCGQYELCVDEDTCVNVDAEFDGDGDPICDCQDTCVGQLDCAGVCNGPSVEDNCGVCDGDNCCEKLCEAQCTDVYACDDETACNHQSCTDECTYPEENYDCSGNCINYDCDGNCPPEVVIDECDICDGSGMESYCIENFGELGSGEYCNCDCDVDYGCGCNNITKTDCGCSLTDGGDPVYECDVSNCPTDYDNDGWCDTEDTCVGTWFDCSGNDCGASACNTNNCYDIPDDQCDCDGNTLDECGECGGDGVLDECGVCDGDGIADGACDCDGNVDLGCGCGNPAAESGYDCDGNCITDCDCAGISGGDAAIDCLGVCGGDAVNDECGICDGVITNPVDCEECIDGWSMGCDGDCAISGEETVEDECGVCGGDGIADGACDCDGNVDLDCGCGEVGPSGCDNTCGSTLEEDCAGVCGGDAAEDECGVCNGDGPEENFDCDGNCIVVEDCNGDCAGDAVEDCFGVCDGNAELDDCGICDGDNSDNDWVDPATSIGLQCSCVDGNQLTWDCNNECGGGNVENPCGECYNPYGDVPECTQDCNGDWGGDTALDACNVCGGSAVQCSDDLYDYEGTCTNDEGIYCDCAGNINDCNGDCGGSLVDDVCGVCDGDGYATACDGNDGIGGIYSPNNIEGYCCDCEGNIYDECGECGGSGIEEGTCDCEGSDPIFLCWNGNIECSESDCEDEPALTPIDIRLMPSGISRQTIPYTNNFSIPFNCALENALTTSEDVNGQIGIPIINYFCNEHKIHLYAKSEGSPTTIFEWTYYTSNNNSFYHDHSKPDFEPGYGYVIYADFSNCLGLGGIYQIPEEGITFSWPIIPPDCS